MNLLRRQQQRNKDCSGCENKEIYNCSRGDNKKIKIAQDAKTKKYKIAQEATTKKYYPDLGNESLSRERSIRKGLEILNRGGRRWKTNCALKNQIQMQIQMQIQVKMQIQIQIY